MSKRPQYYAILLIGAAVLFWLLFFLGPELIDLHNNFALIGAIALYIGAPFAIYYLFRTLRS